MEDWSIIILSAGKGTRLKSVVPKPLVKINDRHLIANILDISDSLDFKDKYVVISKYTKEVQDLYPNYTYVNTIPKGTAHAVMACINKVKTTNVIIAQADDSFFYTEKTLDRIISRHINAEADFTVGLSEINNVSQYKSAIFNEETWELLGLNTDSKSLPGQKVVCGLYAGRIDWIKEVFPYIEPTPSNGEFGIPTGFLMGIEKKDKIFYSDVRMDEWFGINNQEELGLARIKYEGLHTIN